MKTTITSWSKSRNDGGAWVAQHELRREIFIDRMGYQVQSADLLEFDQFDTPRATYIVVMSDDDGAALACCRLVPTVFPTMVGTLWPELLGSFDLSSWGHVEATRIGVRHELAPSERKEALDRVIQGTLEFAFKCHLKGIIGVMPQSLFRCCLEASGCVVNYLAAPIDIDGKKTVAGLIDIAGSLENRSS